MAEKKGPAGADQAKAPEVETDDDFWKRSKDLAPQEIDGWYSPAVSLMKKERLDGVLVGYTEFETKFGTRQTIIMKLKKPIHAAVKEGGEMFKIGVDEVRIDKLAEGKNIGVGLSFYLMGLLDYVEHQGRALIVPSEQAKLADGRRMWKFAVRVVGKKGERPVASRPAGGGMGDGGNSDAFGDDDLPF